MDSDNNSTYLYFNETFKIHTDDSDFQLGAVISQKGKPIYLYSRNLNYYHKSYTVTEKEPLRMVETQKYSRTIFIGHKLIIYTDHKSLTCKNSNNDIVLR